MTQPLPKTSWEENSQEVDADVDRIVDALLDDPSSARKAKALLTRKLEAPDVVRVAVQSRRNADEVAIEDADDDLWDNVPV